MAKADILSILQAKQTSPFDFSFDMLMAPPLFCLIHPQDGWDIYELARSLKYSSKLDYKLNCIDQIMRSRGFVKMLAGTNRVIYRYLEDNGFLLKIPFDRVALSDNINEFNNQFKLKPFVPKTFEVHPSGSIALVERVQPIRRMYEFIEIADDIFDIITNNFIGKYVLEDIGTQYFMNWGIRSGFGPVLLDYPYCYELDGNKLYCNNVDTATGIVCNGVIDYDYGFNELRCPVCGKRYTAKDLEQAIEKKLIIMKGEYKMKVQLVKGNHVITAMPSSDVIERPAVASKPKNMQLEVSIVKNGVEKCSKVPDVKADKPEVETTKTLVLDDKIQIGEQLSIKSDEDEDMDKYVESAKNLVSEAKCLGGKRGGIMDKFIDPNVGELSNVEICQASSEAHKKSFRRRGPDGRFIKGRS